MVYSTVEGLALTPLFTGSDHVGDVPRNVRLVPEGVCFELRSLLSKLATSGAPFRNHPRHGSISQGARDSSAHDGVVVAHFLARLSIPIGLGSRRCASGSYDAEHRQGNDRGGPQFPHDMILSIEIVPLRSEGGCHRDLDGKATRVTTDLMIAMPATSPNDE
jgi:hypothetical protein